jgi:RimJ/RimL family protein N-acetyltransferase
VADLRLEALESRHLQDLDALLRDPLVLRFTPIPDPVPEDQAQTLFKTYLEDETREAHAAVDPDGRFVGLGVVLRIDPVARECELGYMVSAEQRGRGAAAELLRLLTARALHDLGMQRVVLRIDDRNVASERVAVRNGYVREGILRSTYVKPGVRCDTSLWSRLASDPAPE